MQMHIIPQECPAGNIPVSISYDIETWKSLSSLDFPMYEISSYGKIRNIKSGKILKSIIKDSGYYRISLVDKNGIRLTQSVHKLVTYLFLGPRPTKEYTIDHIDRNPSNNYYKNLRWVTGTIQASNRSYKKSKAGRPVYQYDLMGNFIKRWDTAVQASEMLQMKNFGGSISSVCRGKRSNAGGFIWKYADEIEAITGEIWKQIPYPEYGGILISNFGRIKYLNGRINYGRISEGYYITILKNIYTGASKKHLIHRLVMATFVEINDELQVNHKDGDKSNNKLENLEYVNQSQNIQHANDMGLVKRFYRPVIKTIIATGEEIKYSSIKIAAEQNNICSSIIGAKCRGVRPNGKDGVSWRYADSNTQLETSSHKIQSNHTGPTQTKFLSLIIVK
jgi:hypothetical protein